MTSILTRLKLIPLPLAKRSLWQQPPLPSALIGVRAEQSNTGLAGVEMDEALNTTRQGMKYWTGWSNFKSCCSLGRSFSRMTCPLLKSLVIAFTIIALVSSSPWYKLTCLSRTLLASLLFLARKSSGLPLSGSLHRNLLFS